MECSWQGSKRFFAGEGFYFPFGTRRFLCARVITTQGVTRRNITRETRTMKDLSKICTQSRGTADAQRFTVTKGALRSMAIAGMFAAAVSPAFAQTTTADVVGTATDVSGAVVPNATVTLTDVNTHLTRTVKAGSGGEYTFTLLNPGTYSLSVTASGFKTFQITTFNLSA